jgi:hypothetical protein
MPQRYEEDDIDVLGQMLWSVIRVAAVLTVLALAAWLWWGLA